MATPSPLPSSRSGELAALLGRVSLGDRVAFATLYRLTSAHLLGVVLRINSDRAQAEDLLQEVYVKIWGAAGSFDASRVSMWSADPEAPHALLATPLASPAGTITLAPRTPVASTGQTSTEWAPAARPESTAPKPPGVASFVSAALSTL